MDNKHDIFISYSRHDAEVVDEFVDRLEKESYSVWIDREGIESGDAFKKIILQAIKNSTVVLFFSSRHSNQSSWTAKEIGVAVKYKKSIIPILLDDTNFNEEVEFDLINLDYVDYQDVSLRMRMMDKLLKSVKVKIPVTIAQKKAEEARLKAEAAERERLEQERKKVEAERNAREIAEQKAAQVSALSESPVVEPIPISPQPMEKPTRKKWLWIGIGLVVLVIGGTFFGIMTKRNAPKSVYPGYFRTDSGLDYCFYSMHEGETPQLGDILDICIDCVVNDTSVIVPVVSDKMQLVESQFSGDLYEGLAMMHKGDSASFIVNIDSTFIYLFDQPSLPIEYHSTDVMQFDIRLDDFYPESEYPQHVSAEVTRSSDERIASMMRSEYPRETAQAILELSDYLTKNRIDVKPTKSGLYYLRTREGDGVNPQAGQTVSVHYTGKLLDGTVFDSTIERGEPFSCVIGVGQVIPGWDEGIMMMSKGEKGVLYIPCFLAYGSSQAGDMIPPFSNLIFEVELVDIE